MKDWQRKGCVLILAAAALVCWLANAGLNPAVANAGSNNVSILINNTIQ